MSKIISKEDVNQMRAWAMSDRGGAKNTKTKVENVDVPPPQMTLEEMEATQKQAYDEGFNQGRQDGFQTGHQEGLMAGQKMIHEKAAQFDHLLSVLNAPFEALDEEVEQQLVELSLLVAQQFIQHELEHQPDLILSIIRQGIGLLPVTSRNIRIRLNPEDAMLVKENKLNDDQENPWNIIDDPAIAKGGCIINTEHSRIDATIEKRLNEIINQTLGQQREE